MTTRTPRALALLAGTATLAAVLAGVPVSLRAQDTTSTGGSTAPGSSTMDSTGRTEGYGSTTASRDTIPSALAPLFQGIRLTADQSRQVAQIWDRAYNGMGAGAAVPAADSLPASGDSTSQQNDSSSVGMGRQSSLPQSLTQELRAVLTKKKDLRKFDRNVEKFRAERGSGISDSVPQGGRPADSTPPPPGSTRDTTGTTGEPTERPNPSPPPPSSEPSGDPTGKP